MNVNGLAGGLELYLGEDILRDSDGLLIPVQWKGYDQGMKAYQGEILDKQNIKAAFRAKLKDCEENPDRPASYDWSGIRAILDMMRSAFNHVDEALILNKIEAERDL